MIKTVGIVAEYNPFHNGHKALVDFSLKSGFTHCIAVMSGNFVQRSSPAITEKRVRTKAALKNGVDLVLELPLPYAVSTAQHFAMGAVSSLMATGVVDALSFGSEEGDVAKLSEVAGYLDTSSFSDMLPKYLSKGITFAAARQLVVAEALGQEKAHVLGSPNNLLGVEYIRAANKLCWKVDFLTLPRMGVEHHSKSPSKEFASATFLRNTATDLESLKPYVPSTAYSIYEHALAEGLFPSNPAVLDIAVLAHLRRLKIEDLAKLPDISEGIEHRMLQGIRSSTTIDELFATMKTKRYTHSRIRRLVLAAFLGLTQLDPLLPPPYIRVLGIGTGGEALLSKMKPSATLPFSQSLRHLADLGSAQEHFADLEALSTDLYTLTLPQSQPCGYDFVTPAVFL